MFYVEKKIVGVKRRIRAAARCVCVHGSVNNLKMVAFVSLEPLQVCFQHEVVGEIKGSPGAGRRSTASGSLPVPVRGSERISLRPSVGRGEK